jgi:hypothetical protein
MSRRIETGVMAPAAVGGAAAPTEDDYLGRLAKYIPAEIVGLYVAMVAAAPATDLHYKTILWVIFFLNALLVPIYMLIITSREGKGVLWLQVGLSTLSFPIWAFAMGGPFKELSWYQGWMASILLMFVTVVFGLAKPRPGCARGLRGCT